MRGFRNVRPNVQKMSLIFLKYMDNNYGFVFLLNGGYSKQN